MVPLRNRRMRATLLRVAAATGCPLMVVAACDSEGTRRDEGVLAFSSDSFTSATANAIPCTARVTVVTANTGKVVAQGNSRVDAYDSSKGSYGGSNVLAAGTVRAATTVDVLGGTITGGISPNSPGNFLPIPVPAGARNLPLGAGSPGTVNINGTQDSITLAPGNYVVNNLNVNSPGQIKLQSTGQVNIFVTGTLNLGGTENANGVPNNANFFVGSTNTVNLNSNGKLFGSLYAPKAVVNVNSTVFGSIIGSAVNLNSGAQVHGDISLSCPGPVLNAERPRPLPLPPQHQGCYLGNIHTGWVPATCTTKDTLQPGFKFPSPTAGLTNGAASTTPLQFGEVDATITHFGDETDSTNGTHSEFSVQANTNTFPLPTANHLGWIQLVASSNNDTNIVGTSTGTAICLWDWDLTPMGTNFQVNDYAAHCVGGYVGQNPPNNLPVPNRGLQDFDFGTLGAAVFTDDQGQPSIGMVVRYSYISPDAQDDYFAVVAPDTRGLGQPGHWSQFSGGFLGFGDGSTAKFTNSSVLTRVLAGTCANVSPEVPWPGQCPGQPAALLPNTSPFDATSVTGEKNNLQPLQMIPTLPVYSDSPELVFIEYLASDSGMCVQGADRVYVRDFPGDTGVVPSDVAGEPFWQSPDLFVVPHNATVNVNSEPSDTIVTPGLMYDVWVRVNNDYSCNAVTGVKAHVYLADPAALSSNYTDESMGYGSPGAPNGVRVEASSRGLVGPFTFTAPDAPNGNLHKCILAAVMSDNQPALTGAAEFDAPDSYQVAQRNLQIAACSFALTNATTSNDQLSLVLSVENATASLTDPNRDFELSFDDIGQGWFDTWSSGTGNGTSYEVSPPSNGKITVRLGPGMVTLPAVPLPAAATSVAQGMINIDASVPLPGATLDIDATLTNPTTHATDVHNGGSCFQGTPVGG